MKTIVVREPNIVIMSAAIIAISATINAGIGFSLWLSNPHKMTRQTGGLENLMKLRYDNWIYIVKRRLLASAGVQDVQLGKQNKP